MADLPGRSEFEAQVARALGRTFRGQFGRLMDAFGDEPSMAKAEPLLTQFGEELRAVLQPILERVFVAQVEALLSTPVRSKADGGIGLDWALINERAAQWAREYAFDLVNGITGTTRKALQQQIAGFFTDQRTMGDLRESIGRLFGPVRADMIAQTEVTRAASEGEQAFGRELEALGLRVTYVWQTNADDLVCPICGPRNGKERGDGWTDFPPAHIRCRCWVNTVIKPS